MTLEELKAINNDELIKIWEHAIFPFDLADCQICMTQHSYGRMCEQHLEFSKAVIAILGEDAYFKHHLMMIRENLDKLYALRLSFDSLYHRRPSL